MTTKHSVLFCTVPNADEGARLGRTIVEEGLAACVNVVDGVRSIYSWKGEICDDGEALLVIKTRSVRAGELTARIAAIHPYDVPEVIALPITSGHAPYLAWLDDNVK